MARINIEDSLFKDSRFMDLVAKLGNRHSAMGAVLEAFMVAQEFYLNDECKRMIPLNEWKKRGCLGALIECRLAEVRGDFVYVCGSESQFEWLTQRSEAGKRSAQVRANGRSTESNGRSTAVNGRATSSSSSSSKEINKYTPKTGTRDWNRDASRVHAALQAIGANERYAPERLREALGEDLFKLALKAGTGKLRGLPQNEYLLRNISQALQLAADSS